MTAELVAFAVLAAVVLSALGGLGTSDGGWLGWDPDGSDGCGDGGDSGGCD